MPVIFYIVLYIFAFILGSVIGSFLNVVIYRVPAGISIAKGRSFCPTCHRTLKPYDMIPVLSWLILRRRCRFCGSRIPARYPIVELLGGLLCCLCFAALGFSAGAFCAFAAIAILLAIAYIDRDTMEIPNGLIIALGVVALAAIWCFPSVGLLARVIGAVCISLPMLGLALLIPGSFGGGDIKLMIAAGFLLGWTNALLATFIALITGAVYAVSLIAKKRAGRKTQFAFGPYLALGTGIALLFGDTVVGWYLSLF